MSTDPEHSDPDPASFGMWLLQRLEAMPSRAQYGTAKTRLCAILRELLSAYEVEAPSAAAEEEMRAVLFGLRAGPRQAAEAPAWLRARLRAIDFTEQEIDEFPLVVSVSRKSTTPWRSRPPAAAPKCRCGGRRDRVARVLQE